MSEKKGRSTVQIAQRFINRLPKDMDDELKALIRRAEEGEDTTVEIIELLSPHENIRVWMREQIRLQSGKKAGTRGYGTLAGRPGSIPASKKWICPRQDCIEWFPVIQEDEDAPTCEIHAVKMMRAEKR
jgi:hypothetical protein